MFFPIDACHRKLLVYFPMSRYPEKTEMIRLWWRWTLNTRSARS